MRTLWLSISAPFAAYRGMQAGVFRGTAPVLPPSAAHGLVCNLAGIETRGDPSKVATPLRHGVPPLQIAIGSLSVPEISTLYQQLHSYPVGSSGKEAKPRARGAKYWIAPVRRELIVGLAVMLGVRCPDEVVLERVERGLRGEGDWDRYGLPFAGDNQFLFDRIDVLRAPLAAHWYVPLAMEGELRRGSARLTIGVDREDASRTTTGLYAPLEGRLPDPPDDAWTWVPARPTPWQADAR
ncbi:MAG: type I-MYXAN CRISPR-associated protein Cas5/Cmx5/DevS [Polyangiaceae bacterium]|nr:type I-MYXAN CRISPR-associated protein Cas5/Cmx5/DevS [Polyangiaceae bacterium]